MKCVSRNFLSGRKKSIKHLACFLFHSCWQYLELSGVRGGLCNPSYWEDGFWGWPEDREPVWGWKQPSEGPHYTWEQLECHDCSQGWSGPGFFGGRRKSILLSSAQSVVFNYSCYCGVRIWTGLGGRNVCSVPRFSAWKGVLLTPAPDVRQNP